MKLAGLLASLALALALAAGLDPAGRQVHYATNSLLAARSNAAGLAPQALQAARRVANGRDQRGPSPKTTEPPEPGGF
jgi:hypothetical protein